MAKAQTTVDDIAPGVQDELGVAEGLLDTADPMAIMRSLRHALTRVALRPQVTIPAFARFGARLATAGVDVAARTLGSRLADPVAVEGKDARFRDPAWAQNPFFRVTLEWYLATTKLLLELVEGADLDDATAPKAVFAAGLVTDTMAPTNILFTNPTALKRAFETAGFSVSRGARNFVLDLVENDG